VNQETKLKKKAYKFDKVTKELAVKKANYHCECCEAKLNKKDSKKAEVHHLLPVWVVFNCCPEMSADLIRNLANAVVLCHDCHCFLHQIENGDENKLEVFYQALMEEMRFLDRKFFKNSGKKNSNKELISSLKVKKNAVLALLKEEI
jgi:hypothetical protein